MKRKRSTEPKQKVETPVPKAKTAVAHGSRETTRATGVMIIIGEHIGKMWEASQTSKPKGQL